MHKQASVITNIYSELLECTQMDLLQALRADYKWWEELVAQCKSKSRSDNVCIAADVMADTATYLLEFGRKKDGNQFCEWAQELKNLGIGIYEEEQERQSRDKRRDSFSYQVR